ncbi:NACHT domain-containing protein [Phormidesmis priestleyi]|uniref:NACHT domain-containing protein n=1 Tax=Phormidesmis priestleyi TaxID=268141 RepID=UPI001E5D9609|nr:HEAT repeat domain-containing protein [Phormidesmis priestleyi]
MQSCPPVQNGVKSDDLKDEPKQFEVLAGLRQSIAQHQKSPQVLLVGKPGSGKSTALKRLLWEEAQAALTNPGLLIPVLVELRELDGSNHKSVLDLLEATFRRNKLRLKQDLIEDLLFEGRILVLLDGLNEVPTAICEVESFRADYEQVPMVFTSRELGTSIAIEHKLEMVSLTEPQMRRFVEMRLPGHAKALLKAMGDRLRDLAETPLMLTMLCEVYRPDQPVPQNRGELFRRKFIQDYDTIHKAEGTIVVSEGFYEFKNELLQHLAGCMMRFGDQPTEFVLQIDRRTAEDWLEKWLRQRGETDPATKAKRWLKDLLKYHLLQVASEPNKIEFHHQLFQEYYAAEQLLRQLPQLNNDCLKWDYLNYLKWTEPFALMLELVEDEQEALRVVRSALEVDWQLGARLAGKVKPEWQEQTIEMVRSLNLPQMFKIHLLGVGRSKAAIPALIECLKDEDSFIRGKAAFALGEIGSDSVIQSLIELLEDEDSFVRWKAADGLGEAGSEAAIPPLINLFKDEDVDVRESAAFALGKIGSEAVIQSLIKLLKDGKVDVCKNVVLALGEIGTDAVIPLLVELLRDEDFSVRWETAFALGKIGTDIAVLLLVELLEDENSYMREVAAHTLGEIGSDTAILPLAELLKDEDSRVRDRAASSLKKIGEHRAIPPSFKILEDENCEASVNAIDWLHETGSEADISELKQCLNYEGFDYENIDTLIAIQNRCKRYNAEPVTSIERTIAPTGAKTSDQQSEQAIAQNIFNFYAPAYGVTGNIEGDLNVQPPASTSDPVDP